MCAHVWACIYHACMWTWVYVTLSPWQRESAGFNNRVGIARHHHYCHYGLKWPFFVCSWKSCRAASSSSLPQSPTPHQESILLILTADAVLKHFAWNTLSELSVSLCTFPLSFSLFLSLSFFLYMYMAIYLPVISELFSLMFLCITIHVLSCLLSLRNCRGA